MKKSEIANISGLVGIRVTDTELEDLKQNAAFQRQEQGLIDYLDSLYEAIAKGGVDPAQTEYLRGQIAAIQFILRLPTLMESEITSAKVQPMNYTPDELAEMDTFVQRRYNPDKGE